MSRYEEDGVIGHGMVSVLSLFCHHFNSSQIHLSGQCRVKGLLVHVASMLSKPVKYDCPWGETAAVCKSFLSSSCICLRLCLSCTNHCHITSQYFLFLAGLGVTIRLFRFHRKPMYVVDEAKGWSLAVSHGILSSLDIWSMLSILYVNFLIDLMNQLNLGWKICSFCWILLLYHSHPRYLQTISGLLSGAFQT